MPGYRRPAVAPGWRLGNENRIKAKL